jgi:hypothetical protein
LIVVVAMVAQVAALFAHEFVMQRAERHERLQMILAGARGHFFGLTERRMCRLKTVRGCGLLEVVSIELTNCVPD